MAREATIIGSQVGSKASHTNSGLALGRDGAETAQKARGHQSEVGRISVVAERQDEEKEQRRVRGEEASSEIK
eukprot:1181849-Pyramimonas_sp.AAC.1